MCEPHDSQGRYLPALIAGTISQMLELDTIVHVAHCLLEKLSVDFYHVHTPASKKLTCLSVCPTSKRHT